VTVLESRIPWYSHVLPGTLRAVQAGTRGKLMQPVTTGESKEPLMLCVMLHRVTVAFLLT
jgi:hypothetical protein